ncbi:MAG: PadR family transcriptional regulator [Propionibacteriales bacterium]|nr:PadR family transcriptional regulator [Propionibacteriales bacterium]
MSTLRLSTTSYLVMGIVALRGPSTSYDMKRAIGHSVGFFWPFPHAQLYSEPKRLVEGGLLEVTVEEDGRRRQTYSINPKGLAALREWLADPVCEPMQVRDVGELKLFLSELADHADVVTLAREQVRQHTERIATYEAIEARFGHREDVAERMLPLGLGLAMERAALDFWRDIEARYAAVVTPGATPTRKRRIKADRAAS